MLVSAIVDLPFALPTIVAGLVLLALYGNNGPVGIDVTFTRASVGLALLFVTLPFVVRSVQPVLIELDRSMEEAAASLGARPLVVFRRVVLPSLAPAIISGRRAELRPRRRRVRLAGADLRELPFKTEVASVVRVRPDRERRRGRRPPRGARSLAAARSSLRRCWCAALQAARAAA